MKSADRTKRPAESEISGIIRRQICDADVPFYGWLPDERCASHLEDVNAALKILSAQKEALMLTLERRRVAAQRRAELQQRYGSERVPPLGLQHLPKDAMALILRGLGARDWRNLSVTCVALFNHIQAERPADMTARIRVQSLLHMAEMKSVPYERLSAFRCTRVVVDIHTYSVTLTAMAVPELLCHIVRRFPHMRYLAVNVCGRICVDNDTRVVLPQGCTVQTVYAGGPLLDLSECYGLIWTADHDEATTALASMCFYEKGLLRTKMPKLKWLAYIDRVMPREAAPSCYMEDVLAECCPQYLIISATQHNLDALAKSIANLDELPWEELYIVQRVTNLHIADVDNVLTALDRLLTTVYALWPNARVFCTCVLLLQNTYAQRVGVASVPELARDNYPDLKYLLERRDLDRINTAASSVSNGAAPFTYQLECARILATMRDDELWSVDDATYEPRGTWSATERATLQNSIETILAAAE